METLIEIVQNLPLYPNAKLVKDGVCFDGEPAYLCRSITRVGL